LRLFPFGGYGWALAALARAVFGAIECIPFDASCETSSISPPDFIFMTFEATFLFLTKIYILQMHYEGF